MKQWVLHDVDQKFPISLKGNKCSKTKVGWHMVQMRIWLRLTLSMWFNVVKAPKEVTSFPFLRELYQKKSLWSKITVSKSRSKSNKLTIFWLQGHFRIRGNNMTFDTILYHILQSLVGERPRQDKWEIKPQGPLKPCNKLLANKCVVGEAGYRQRYMQGRVRNPHNNASLYLFNFILHDCR